MRWLNGFKAFSIIPNLHIDGKTFLSYTDPHICCSRMFADIIETLFINKKNISPLFHVQLLITSNTFKVKVAFCMAVVKKVSRISSHACDGLFKSVIAGIHTPDDVIERLLRLIGFFSNSVQENARCLGLVQVLFTELGKDTDIGKT